MKEGLRDELDRLARTVCMVLAGAAEVPPERGSGQAAWWGGCLKCGRTKWLAWCHVVTRANYHVRWDEDNTFAWCAGCHRTLDQHWEQKQAWVRERVGAARYDAMMMRARAVGRVDYAGLRVALKARLAGLLRQGG